jgi:hypothetical protein
MWLVYVCFFFLPFIYYTHIYYTTLAPEDDETGSRRRCVLSPTGRFYYYYECANDREQEQWERETTAGINGGLRHDASRASGKFFLNIFLSSKNHLRLELQRRRRKPAGHYLHHHKPPRRNGDNREQEEMETTAGLKRALGMFFLNLFSFLPINVFFFLGFINIIWRRR